ncbi:MAG: hypothetical protein F6K53_17085 [Moorea sp. SIO4A1]|nr:hypothetical protein [Moorena sp. SIO4A1]
MPWVIPGIDSTEVKLLRLLRFETFVMSAPALATAINLIFLPLLPTPYSLLPTP